MSLNLAVDQLTLLRTKLHRPRVTADLVARSRLEGKLNSSPDRSLILVCAPAGFGKSTLLSAWLETCDHPHAWVSLDENDNNLTVFLSYFVAAVQSIFPNTLAGTQAHLTGLNLPSVEALARSLINELDELERDFVLVLDDYHTIREQSIHDILSTLLQHPPRGMRLVVVTRRDPLLPLAVLRARNQIHEIRAPDLRFSLQETAEFMAQTLGAPLADDALAALAEKTEGWAAGLRLATLTLRQGGEVANHIARLPAENRYVIDYLMSEVLAQVPPAIRGFLLKTSILDQMCGPLCQEVIGPDDAEGHPLEYLEWLEQAGMFTVAVDADGQWYRYHHLFKVFLRDRLAREHSAGEIAMLHARASVWYARQGLLEEALQHALRGHDTPAAARLMAEHRHALMDSEQWQLYERCLQMFPAEAVADFPDLILMAAWMARMGRFDSTHVLELVDQAESLAAQMPDQPEHAVHLRGEIDTLRLVLAYEAASDPEEVIVFARQALATLPRAWYYVRSTAWLYRATAHQMAGRLDQAYATLAEGQPEDVTQDGAVHVRLAASRGFLEWMAGDLQAMPRGAAHALGVAETHHRRESLGWAHYLLSTACYQSNDLAGAEAHAQALEGLRYVGRPMAYLQSAFVYASIQQAQGQRDQARQKLDLAFEFLRETRNLGLVPLAQAFQAELAMMQGDLGVASHWATTIGIYWPLTALPYFYAPQLTLPKILLAQNTAASRNQAAEVLSRLLAFLKSTHNTRFTIEVLALQALLHDAQGEEAEALAVMEQAVSMAEPGGFIRLFVDLGPRIANLLVRLQGQGIAPGYTNRILNAFVKDTPAAPAAPAASGLRPVVSPAERLALVEPLTDREHEILALLAERLSDKEIARALFISPQTVKRHTANIYQKLQVNGRREAVSKAAGLGLL